MFQVKTSSKEIWNAKKQISFLLRNYLEPKLFFAEITLCRNYPVLELSCSWTILCRNYPFLQLFLASNHVPLSPFGSCKFCAPLVPAPLCEPKSHLIIAVRSRIPIGKNTWKNELNLLPNIFKYFQIFKTNIQLYLIISSVSCSKFKYKISGS